MAITLGKKIKMNRIFDQKGDSLGITKILCSPCYFVGIKTPEKDCYSAVILGFGQSKHIKKPVQGQLKKAKIETKLTLLKEFRLDEENKSIVIKKLQDDSHSLIINDKEYSVGSQLPVERLFQKGDKVIVTGISKGKGFQGVVARHGFAGGPRTHGQSDRERAPGSIGQTTTPGRVYKGKKMAGRVGNETITIRGITVVDIKDSMLLLKGSIPGSREQIVQIRKQP